MRYNGLALLMLAGTIALSGCGSTAAPTSAPDGLSNAAPSLTAPQELPSKAQPQVKPATGAKAPSSNVTNTPAAQGQTGTGANVSGGSAIGAPQTEIGNAAPAAPAYQTKGGMGWGNTDFVVFASNRYPNEGNNDIFVFDPLQDTVLAIVGVNTYDNEFNPRISDNGKWLVFQRTVGGAYQDVLLYSMDAKLVNTLHNLNTELYNEYMPDVTNDGCKIVYVSDESGYPEVRLYDVTTGDNWVVPGANRNFKDITWPTISANGLKIAYGASIAPGYGYATTAPTTRRVVPR